MCKHCLEGDIPTRRVTVRGWKTGDVSIATLGYVDVPIDASLDYIRTETFNKYEDWNSNYPLTYR